MDTIDVNSTGGTKLFNAVWASACGELRPVDAGRHSKYCNTSFICRHNAIIWNAKWGYVDSRSSNQGAGGLLVGDDGFDQKERMLSESLHSFFHTFLSLVPGVQRFAFSTPWHIQLRIAHHVIYSRFSFVCTLSFARSLLLCVWMLFVHWRRRAFSGFDL